MKRFKKHPGPWLLAACYAAGLLVLLGVHLAGYIANRAAYAGGALAPAELSAADFEWVDLVEVDGALVSTSGDPQLILKDATRRVENVTLEADYTLPPLTETVYWAAPGRDYSVSNMAGPAAEGPARFWLPVAGGQSLRIDPGNVAGNTITVRRVLVNQPRPFWAFFVPAAGEVILLAALPGLAAGGLWLALSAVKLAGFGGRGRKAAAGGSGGSKAAGDAEINGMRTAAGAGEQQPGRLPAGGRDASDNAAGPADADSAAAGEQAETAGGQGTCAAGPAGAAALADKEAAGGPLPADAFGAEDDAGKGGGAP